MIYCKICGSSENLQKHHIIPIAQGGDNGFNNRITICAECHRKIHEHGIGLPRNFEIKDTIPIPTTTTPPIRYINLKVGSRNYGKVLPRCTCQRCGNEWTPTKEEVIKCSKCKSSRWDKPRRILNIRNLINYPFQRLKIGGTKEKVES